ncbi:MAG: cell division protein FtsZ, partial [Rhodobacteraceae bacterium]
ISLRGAKGVLINITGSHDLTLFELDEAANRIREEVDPEANIIVGSTLDTSMEGLMRVSVVATGIDASESAHDMPVPRRSMKQPLTPPVMSAPAPRREEAPMAEPAQTRPAMAADEPSLFEDLEDEQTAASAMEDGDFGDDDLQQVSDDDLPPPAYRPQVAEFQPRTADFEPEDVAETFVAPKPRAAGTPSPEALERLRAAAQRVPTAAGAPPRPQASGVAAEKPRFGINSLINRMTGHASDTPAQAPRQQPPVAQRPAPSPAASAAPKPRDAAEPDQERIEIPAFLRRQAN